MLISSSLSCSLFTVKFPSGTYNVPRNAFDLYTPRMVKGKGKDKVGLCPICIESVKRGGEGKKVWLSMKFSAYNYHLQYRHGISASSGQPYLPPIAFRITVRRFPQKTEKAVIKEGKCHQCKKWVAVEGVKDVEVKVKEMFWWKHAASCHGPSNQDVRTIFEQDEYFQKLEGFGA
ncbi:hypothetical protein K435DRAFT_660675 [Dendrothele bispora CBS 962.96]|uniref:Transcription regulator Rua1 C-terminal domain-containing protein n=1 Tax=Dendrothele bispora (strain CBS 962.96) TaxID=1314807 RepID=A0A4S8M8U2_DENBC|nr:hypothetical protein K435DRAFT_660675 [Dendrothele bispora CBS 962.96]